MRSGRTFRRGGEDRSWFGRPQAIKKAAGSAARNKGTNASKTLGIPAAPPSSGSQWCCGCRLRTAKKKGAVPPAPSSTHHPLAKGSKNRLTEEIPISRRRYDQTSTGVSNPRKSRGPTLCSVRRIHLLRMMLFYVRSVTNTSTIGRTAH